MVPDDLKGPDEPLRGEDQHSFLRRTRKRYPQLPLEFLQVCYDDHARMDDYFPWFSTRQHRVVERIVSTAWLQENVKYDDGESLESESFYGFQVGLKVPGVSPEHDLAEFMRINATWPLRPIIVETRFAYEALGCQRHLGAPYQLLDGSRRVSILLRMLALDMVPRQGTHSVLELAENAARRGCSTIPRSGGYDARPK